ncbi:MAG: hypothetical protein JXP34_14795 [Planctomycetes bacterium]|nr:hypothetical protein [Planctomycetota bacterium]
MSDDELRAECAPGTMEALLDRAGCGASLIGACILTALLVFAARRLSGLGYPALVLAAIVALPALAMSAFFFLNRISGARRRPFRDELGYRYGTAPREAYVQEAHSLFAGEDPPDVVFLLSASALPSGDHRWVRVVVRKTPIRHGTVEVRDTEHAENGIESARVLKAEGELPDGSVQTLLALLEGPGAGALSDLPPEVMDGLPCTVTVIERDHGRERVGRCNLAGVSGRDEGRPSVAFSKALLAAAKHVTRERLSWGACSAFGEITFGDV